MKIKWLVQDVGKTLMLNDNFNTLKELNYSYNGFGVIEGLNIISNLELMLTNLDENYIIRGGTKIISLFEDLHDINLVCNDLNEYQKENGELFLKKLKAGIFYDDKLFDQHYYNKLDLPLLNKDAFFLDIKTNKETIFEKPYFIKPSRDLKTFIPGIIQPGQSIKEFIESSQHLKQYDHEIALISPVKKIFKEYRFFVIDNKVITGSQYKNGDLIEYDFYIPNNVKSIAMEYAKLYKPHNVFTMDLAVTDNDIKIVEYNCWNGSGLYHCDKKLIFQKVQEYMIDNNNL